MSEETPPNVVWTRRYWITVEAMETPNGFRWKFPRAYASWSTELYTSAEAAFNGAKMYAQLHQMPISAEGED